MVFMCICMFGSLSVTFVWSIAQGAVAVISIGSMVVKVSLLFTVGRLLS